MITLIKSRYGNGNESSKTEEKLLIDLEDHKIVPVDNIKQTMKTEREQPTEDKESKSLE